VHHNRSMAAHLETILEPISRSASVRSIYGDPISVNGKTIIPVARIAYGFGGGSGRKQNQSNPQEGEGGGGGVYAQPVGVLEVTETETRFIALSDRKRLAGAALVGFCLGAFWARSRR
jgi:uncharacterized spore protein YtfJ